MTQDTEDVVARLRHQAESASKIHRSMAEAKSLRQESNPEGRTDLYMWPTPEQTIEGRAADLIQSLSDRIDGLRCAGNALAETVKMSKAALVASLTKRELEILMADLHAWNVAALHQEGP